HIVAGSLAISIALATGQCSSSQFAERGCVVPTSRSKPGIGPGGHSLKVSPSRFLSIGAGAQTERFCAWNETIYPEGLGALDGNSSEWQRRHEHTELSPEKGPLRLRQHHPAEGHESARVDRCRSRRQLFDDPGQRTGRGRLSPSSD